MKICSLVMAIVITALVSFFPRVTPEIILIITIVLLGINCFVRTARIAIFVLSGYIVLSSGYPLLNSVVFNSYRDYIFGVDLFFCAVFAIILTKFITDSKISLIRLLLATVISSLLFIKYVYIVSNTTYLDLVMMLLVSSVFVFLLNNRTVQFKKNRSRGSIIFFVIAVFLFFAPIQKAPVRLNIGLLESKWCNTTGTFTTDYSMKSAYSYSLMKKLISNRHNVIWIQEYADVEKYLSSLDVLLLLTPIKPFSHDLRGAIERFVGHGGKLVAIADHTDLYGHATVLNELISPYNIRINNTALFKPNFKECQISVSGLPVSTVPIKTPSSISLYQPAYVWAWADGWISEHGDYTRPNFFGELSWSSDDTLGKWVIGASVKHKKGEVVLFCDSTIFANFCVFQPGYISILDLILSKPSTASTFVFFGFFAALFLFISVLARVPKDFEILFLIILLIIVLLSTRCTVQPEDYFPTDSRIDVYCDPAIVFEEQPIDIPIDVHFCNAFSSIPRSGLLPFYRGIQPPNVISNYSLWITTYQEFIEKLPSLKPDNLKIVITDTLPAKNLFDIPDRHFKYERNLFFEKALGVLPCLRTYYTRDGFYTFEYKGFSILMSYGILNDRFVGNWWVNNDISPFRRYIFSSFHEWLLNNKPISEYHYPEIGIKNLNASGSTWQFKTEDGEESELTVEILSNQQPFAYFGSGIWGHYSRTNGGEFVLGGAETSDDLLSSSMRVWAVRKKL